MPDIVTEIFLIGMFLAAFIEKFDGWGICALDLEKLTKRVFCIFCKLQMDSAWIKEILKNL